MTRRPQDEVAKLYSRLNTFRMDDVFVDVTLVCEDGKASFQDHRLFLTAASDYFELVWFSRSRGKHTVKTIVHLGKVSTATLREVQRFIYTGDAKIDCVNSEDVFRASDFFRLSSLKCSSISFLKQNVRNFQTMYSYSHKENVLTDVLRPDLVGRSKIFRQAAKFFEFAFTAPREIIKMNEQFLDEIISGEITRRIGHLRKSRFEYIFDQMKFISFETTLPIFPELTCINARRCEAPVLDSVRTVPICQQSRRPSPSLSPVVSEFHISSRVLHTYINFAAENLIRIFTIEDSAEKCTLTGQFPVVHTGKYFTTSVFNDDLLLRLHFPGEDGTMPSLDEQFFHIHPSANMQIAAPLKLPPIVFTSVNVCQVRNVMYAYHEALCGDTMRTTQQLSSRTFSDEELCRSIFAYNCDLDEWFPVPEVRERVKWAGFTTLDDILYLIGGSFRKYMQAFDYREGIWRNLPRTETNYFNATACCLWGKVFIFGGFETNHCERYDCVAGRWERVNDLQPYDQLNPKAITYRHAINLFDRDPNPSHLASINPSIIFQQGMYHRDNESPDGQIFTWTGKAADMMMDNASYLMDCVVFRKF